VGKLVKFGLDPHGRFYLAANFVWKAQSGMACLFQRYTDSPSFFVNCLDHVTDEIFSSNLTSDGKGRLSSHHFDTLQLVSKGTFMMPSVESVYLAV